MAIIDTHTHLGHFPAIEEIADELVTRPGVARWRSAYPEVYERVRSERALDNSEALLAAMDENSVDISIVQPTVGVPNEDVLQWVAPHDRLVPLAWAAQLNWDGRWNEDPSPEVTREVSEAAARTAEWALGAGFVGIGETCARDITREVDPVLIARDLAPLMDVLEGTGRPIQFPTGWTQFPGNLFYQDPLWVDEVAGRHPNVPIILTKMGRGIQRFFDSAFAVAIRNKNIYFDMLASTPEHLRTALDVLGPERVMFATDWSYTWRYLSKPGNVYTSSLDIIDKATSDPSVRSMILETNAKTIFSV